MKVLKEAVAAYVQNIKWISLFSLAFLIAFPLSTFLPSFVSAGANFLRFGSIPTDMTSSDLAIMAFLSFVSLSIISFAVVSINLIIKAQRTVTNVQNEILNKIPHYVSNVFWAYLIATLFSLFFDIFFFERGMHTTFGMLSSLIIWLSVLYYPNAIVIDDMKAAQAFPQSVRTLMNTFPFVILWVVIGGILIVISDLIAIATAPIAALLLNAIVILPFLTVLQSKIYMSKYSILG